MIFVENFFITSYTLHVAPLYYRFVFFILASAIQPLDIAQKKPMLKDVHELLKISDSKWNDIGREFNVPFGDREGLRTDISLYNSDRLERVLYIWLEQETSICTWEHFIKVLRDELSLKGAVRETQKFIQSSEATEKYGTVNN